MAIVDYDALLEFPMRAGLTGKWLVGPEHGSSTLSLLVNTVEAGSRVPRHRHTWEEVILVQEGRIWVALEDNRSSIGLGQLVIVPPHTVHAWGNDGPARARVLFVWPVREPFAPGNSTYLEGMPPSVS